MEENIAQTVENLPENEVKLTEAQEKVAQLEAKLKVHNL